MMKRKTKREKKEEEEKGREEEEDDEEENRRMAGCAANGNVGGKQKGGVPQQKPRVEKLTRMLYRCGTLDSHMVIAEDSNSGRSSLSVGPF